MEKEEQLDISSHVPHYALSVTQQENLNNQKTNRIILFQIIYYFKEYSATRCKELYITSRRKSSYTSLWKSRVSAKKRLKPSNFNNW